MRPLKRNSIITMLLLNHSHVFVKVDVFSASRQNDVCWYFAVWVKLRLQVILKARIVKPLLAVHLKGRRFCVTTFQWPIFTATLRICLALRVAFSVFSFFSSSTRACKRGLHCTPVFVASAFLLRPLLLVPLSSAIVKSRVAESLPRLRPSSLTLSLSSPSYTHTHTHARTHIHTHTHTHTHFLHHLMYFR